MRDETPRASFRHSCGADLKPVLTCAACGEEFKQGSLMHGPPVSAADPIPVEQSKPICRTGTEHPQSVLPRRSKTVETIKRYSRRI